MKLTLERTDPLVHTIRVDSEETGEENIVKGHTVYTVRFSHIGDSEWFAYLNINGDSILMIMNHADFNLRISTGMLNSFTTLEGGAKNITDFAILRVSKPDADGLYVLDCLVTVLPIIPAKDLSGL